MFPIIKVRLVVKGSWIPPAEKFPTKIIRELNLIKTEVYTSSSLQTAHAWKLDYKGWVSRQVCIERAVRLMSVHVSLWTKNNLSHMLTQCVIASAHLHMQLDKVNVNEQYCQPITDKYFSSWVFLANPAFIRMFSLVYKYSYSIACLVLRSTGWLTSDLTEMQNSHCAFELYFFTDILKFPYNFEHL